VLEGSVSLEAGRHDIVLGYFQQTGGGGIRVRVRLPGQTSPVALPNAWLTPYSQTGALAGGGALALPAVDALLRAHVAAGGSRLGGTLTGVSGTQFAKSGGGLQSLAGGGVNAFAGDVDVQGGILGFDADERLADVARLTVQAGATFALAGAETVGALVGGGTLPSAATSTRCRSTATRTAASPLTRPTRTCWTSRPTAIPPRSTE
jgi:autotransporter-associated beta strand protein